MSKTATILHRRSLTFATVAFFFGFVALEHIIDFSGRVHEAGEGYVRQSLIVCVVSFAVCAAVLANLILDVGRGYSPNRCSLAAVISLLAFSGPVMLALDLIGYCGR